MRTLLAAAALAVLPVCVQPVLAQGSIVSGTVKDQAGHSIKGATISAESRQQPGTIATTSDRKGRFALQPLPPGAWYFSVEAPGYESLERPLTIAPQARALKIQIRLAPSAVPSSLAGMTGRQVQQRIDAAEASAARGDVDGAIATYNDLLARVPALSSVYLQLGVLHERKHDTAAALAAYRRLAELEPGNAKARAAIQRLTERR